MNRRSFLQVSAAAATTTAALAQSAPDWGGNVIDIHFHFRRGNGANALHLDGSGVSHAVLLTRYDDDSLAQAEIQANPKRYVRFTQADITKPSGVEQLRAAVKAGSRGFGEIKYHVAVDGPEMKRMYDLAAELGVPVLIHFAEVEQYPGEGVFAPPYKNLPAVLKAHKRTTFIGHADGFWANISAKVPGDTPYPEGPVVRGGLTDKMLGDYPNLYGDLSANSGRNALARDAEFTKDFLKRHQNKLMFGCDCSCKDGKGTGQGSKRPLIAGKCVARETLAALKQSTTPEVFRKLTWTNATKLLKLNF